MAGSPTDRRCRPPIRSRSSETEIATERTALLTAPLACHSHYVRDIQVLIEQSAEDANAEQQDYAEDPEPSEECFMPSVVQSLGLNDIWYVRPHRRWWKDLEQGCAWVCLACEGRACKHGYTCYVSDGSPEDKPVVCPEGYLSLSQVLEEPAKGKCQLTWPCVVLFFTLMILLAFIVLLLVASVSVFTVYVLAAVRSDGKQVRTSFCVSCWSLSLIGLAVFVNSLGVHTMRKLTLHKRSVGLRTFALQEHSVMEV